MVGPCGYGDLESYPQHLISSYFCSFSVPNQLPGNLKRRGKEAHMRENGQSNPKKNTKDMNIFWG